MTCVFTSFSMCHIWTMRVDNERLCAMEPRLRLRSFRIERGSNLGPLDQQASAKPSELPGLCNSERKQFAPLEQILFFQEET